MIKYAELKGIFSKRYNPAFWVAGLPLVVAGMLAGSTVLGGHIIEHYVPLLDVAIEIKLELTLAYYTFEEVVGGTPKKEITEVRAHINRAQWLAATMLEGEKKEELNIVSFHDPELCREIEEVQGKIEEFRVSIGERWAVAQKSDDGSVVDRHHDAMFEAVLTEAGSVETSLKVAMAEEMGRFKVIQGLLFLFCIGLGGVVGGLLYSYEEKKKTRILALHKSEENLSITLNSIGDAVISTDIEGRVTRMNPVAEALTGWPEAEALTRPLDKVFHIIHAQTRKKAESIAEKVLREGVVVGLANHTILISRDGTEYQIAESGAPIRDEKKVCLGVVLVFRDVTEKYAREHQIRERMKELKCMYGVAESIRTRDTLEEVFQDVAELIPSGWMFPGITRGRVVFGEKEYVSEPFKETPWRQSADIIVSGEVCGSVEIFHLEERPELDEGPFMTEERNLLAGIVRVLGETIERKQAEVETAGERRLMNALMDGIPDRIYFQDTDGRFLCANRAVAELFGVDDPAEIVGKTDFDFHPKEHAYKTQADDAEIIRAGRLVIAKETRRTRPDGKDEWASTTKIPLRDTGGQIVGMFGITRDVTECRRVEEERERFMAAIEQAAETIVITDVEGIIEYVNPAFEKITGYTREEAVGRNPRILQGGEQDEAFYKAMWDILLRGETWTGRFVNKKKDGALYTEEATISPVRDASGRTVNYVAAKRDVSEEIKMEDQLRQAQKMQSIGQLVGGVAHDFNNLLQIINGYAGIVRAKLGKGHAAAGAVEEVCKAGERAKDLVKQLLSFSRQQVIEPVNLDLNEVVEDSRKMLGQLIGEHVLLAFIAGTETEKVFVDKNQLQQVLMNLCVNARDAMPDGGKLTIKTESLLIAPRDLKAQTWARPGRYVLLSVADTGCGMDKSTCERIFEPFFTTKGVGKGTGLGLSTVYGIVKQNEGHINVYSEPGEGTVFKIYLPVSNPLSSEADGQVVEAATAIEGGVETLLVVEDDEALLELAVQILSEAGYTGLTAKDGEEAVRVFEEHADEIDLVIMDVVMPRMGGKEAMGKILEKRPALRHLFVSGYTRGEGQAGFIKGKGMHLLNKPYQSEDLLKKIRDVLDED